jgi:hypothetical protein
MTSTRIRRGLAASGAAALLGVLGAFAATSAASVPSDIDGDAPPALTSQVGAPAHAPGGDDDPCTTTQPVIGVLNPPFGSSCV